MAVVLFCAEGRARTGDPILFRDVLYQLSYLGIVDCQILLWQNIFYCVPHCFDTSNLTLESMINRFYLVQIGLNRNIATEN